MEFQLRAFQDEDLSLLEAWLREEHVARWYEDPQSWLEEASRRSGEFSWISHWIAALDGRPVGFCQYYPYWKSGEDWHGEVSPEGTYSLDYLLGDQSCVGRGLGRRMVLLLLERIAALPDAVRVIALPDEKNRASCQTLLSAGFRYDEKNRLYRLDQFSAPG